ncbi:MAG: YceD family protein [Actinomycetes bacterium]
MSPRRSEQQLKIAIAELRRRPGNRQEVDLDVAFAETGLSESAVITATVPADSVGHVHLVLESMSDGVTATGTVRFPWRGECRRCLGPTSGEVVADVLEVYKDVPTGEDTLPVEGDSVDLGPVVRDAVVLALPLAPLCAEDCTGPEPEAYPVVVEGEGEAPPDPRWSALSDLHFDTDATE